MNPKEQEKKIEALEKSVGSLKTELRKLTAYHEVPPHFHKKDRIEFKDLKGGIQTISATPTHVSEQGKTLIHLTNNVLYVKVGANWKYIQMT